LSCIFVTAIRVCPCRRASSFATGQS